MSIWKLFKLNFGKNPVHFGELGIGIEETNERVYSDTLFSAWVSAYARLFGKVAVEGLLREIQEEPLFRLSSTFVYRQLEGQTIYYLPRPLLRPINYPEDDFKFTKAYKKLNYLPLEIWQRWYQGEEGFTKSDSEELFAKTQGKANGDLQKAGTFDCGEAFRKAKIPKIAVDRTTRATNLYSTGFVKFQESSGLYFLAEFSHQNVANTFSAVLNFLGEEGLGGERSSGAGQFKVEVSDLTSTWQQVIDFSGKSAYSLISLFWENPLPNDCLENASYELQKRGGWVSSSPSGSQRRRKSVQMFVEGSVFPVKPQGKLANVTPDGFTNHQIYRSGISLSLPIKISNE
ncbi:MAG: type III-A CRISPR-associated RAMP protein Csm4 [Oscillatoriaceae cyanobacterium Prado104]|jgi:CRISPR-associated protein Csm4|nr:type III-A CRISPR-associated RAMP protein Csm4 [Oscillatoriaceae cyanobacterium Prado104]